MSQSPINRSPDLRKLVDDGYEVDIVADHLVIYNVPYVNADKQVKLGNLVSTLNLAGDVTTRPDTHVVMFRGEYPCNQEGHELTKIKCGSERQEIGDGLVVDHSFSSIPREGSQKTSYSDYHHKMTTYINIISSHAEAIDPNVTARTRRVIESKEPDSVFNYLDTASSRAGITAISDKLKLQKLAIIGLGGTGSYVLDLVAKTPVREIHIFDGDDFLQHNAFRSPGAPSIKELKALPKKVGHYSDLYTSMRKGIFPHDFHINSSNVDILDEMEFVFLCMDQGEAKEPIIEKLEKLGIPFIDVGMGIECVDGKLLGILRVTTSTNEQRDHVRNKKRISFLENKANDVYSQNIQIAELNALNAALAVIKWKKLFGFYLDLEQEHFCTYALDGNSLINEDQNEAANSPLI